MQHSHEVLYAEHITQQLSSRERSGLSGFGMGVSDSEHRPRLWPTAIEESYFLFFKQDFRNPSPFGGGWKAVRRYRLLPAR